MDFKRGLQGQQQVMGSSLGVGQGFYTVESLEKSQPQIFPPGTYAYHSSDGTVPPGSYATIGMQPPPQQEQFMAYQSALTSEYSSYGSSVPVEYGRTSMYGSMVPPRYGVEDRYVPQDVYNNPWHRNEAQNGSTSSCLFQQTSSSLLGENAPVRDYSGYPLSHLGLTVTNNSQVLNLGSTGTAKKKIPSQFKCIPKFAATRKNSMQPIKQRVPTVSGPGAPGWCSICEIECNSKEVLEQHCLGRKHKRQLEKKKEQLAAQMHPKEKNTQQQGSGNMVKSLKRENEAGTQALSDNGLLKSRNQEPTGKLNPDKNTKAGGEAEAKTFNFSVGKRKQKIAADDIFTKRQRLLDAGTDLLAVKVCSLCNTVCNSQTVFDAHLAGKKHAAQVKKLEEEANPVLQVNKLEDQASSILQGNQLEKEAIALPQQYKSEEETNVTSQGMHNGKECTADGELDNKDAKGD